ncbi:MAG: creatininase family protein [Rubrivivax sp.]
MSAGVLAPILDVSNRLAAASSDGYIGGMAVRDWRALVTNDFDGLEAERTIVLLPLGAVEQHGPHLPLGTDALINDGLLQGLRDDPPQADVLILPVQQVGHSLEHTDYAGSLAFGAETLLAAWDELGAAVARAGLRKLVLLNTHGGNNPLVALSALRLRQRLGLFALRANYSAFGFPPGLFAADELAHGIHGGETETSLMLYLHPELVRREAVADFHALPAQLAAQRRWLGVEKPVGFGWMSQDLHAAGVSGNAAAADAQRGEALYRHLVAALRELIDEFAAQPLATLRDRG